MDGQASRNKPKPESAAAGQRHTRKQRGSEVMNCAYHIHNPAVVSCNGCGKALCPACDHRIKGFPYCQDCIVMGVDLLRQQNQSNYAPFVKRRTSPIVATILSSILPGLG